jgi:tRNA1Val (adenine37-N6)-methyltransferase
MAEPHIRPGETFDAMFSGVLRFIQKRKGYRFNEDSLILADFSLDAKGRVIDLGTGCGVIGIILGKFGAASEVAALEIQEGLFGLAERNITLNGLEKNIAAVHGDLRRIKKFFKPHSFDHAVSNPPYMSVGSARVSPDGEKAAARNELLCTAADLAKAAGYLVKPGGTFRVIFPSARLEELIELLRSSGLSPSRLRYIHDRPGSKPKLFLMESVKGGESGLSVLPPLVLHNQDGTPTEEHDRIFRI